MKEKIIKNNLFNRLFHPHQISNNIKKLEDIRGTLWNHKYLIEALNEAETLTELLDIHKRAYAAGYNNQNLSPDPFGMFRTTSISDMKPSEVFLGNIYGLWTNTLEFFESLEHRNRTYFERYEESYTDSYSLVFNQYYHRLFSNIEAMYKSYIKILGKFESLNYK